MKKINGMMKEQKGIRSSVFRSLSVEAVFAFWGEVGAISLEDTFLAVSILDSFFQELVKAEKTEVLGQMMPGIVGVACTKLAHQFLSSLSLPMKELGKMIGWTKESAEFSKLVETTLIDIFK